MSNNNTKYYITFDYRNSCFEALAQEEVQYASVISVSKLVLCNLGFFLNLLSMIIFLRTAQRCIFNTLLLLLSIVEVGLCLSGIIFELFNYLYIIQSAKIHNPWLFTVLTYLCIYIGWFAYKVSFLTRNWIIAYIAWRRYRAVSDPIKNLSSINKSDIYRMLGIIYTICALLTVPRMFETSYRVCIQFSQLMPEDTFLFARKFTKYYSFIYFVCLSLPVVCVVACSLALLHFIRVRNTETNALTTNNTRNTSPTKTVFVLCAVFSLCEAPILMGGILQRFNVMANDNFLIFGGIVSVLTNLDSVLNFGVYYYSIGSFKSLFRVIYMPKCLRPKNSDNNSEMIELRRGSNYNSNSTYIRGRPSMQIERL